jgi:hypothetical protein
LLEELIQVEVEAEVDMDLLELNSLDPVEGQAL